MPAPLEVPRIDDWFWDALESSDHSLRELCRKLEELPREQLYSFQYQYMEAMEYAPPGDQDAPAPLSSGLCPDGFPDEDFADWVVSQGREFYYQLRREPERLQEYVSMYLASEDGSGSSELRWDNDVDREEYRGWQSPFQVGFAIFRARFGKDIVQMIYGHDWDDACGGSTQVPPAADDFMT